MRAAGGPVTLGSLCERITVGHVGPMANSYTAFGVPFLRSQDIGEFHISTSDIKFIPPEFDQKLRKSRLRAGDVAIVRTGYPGTAAVVPQELDGANCADLVILTPGRELDAWFVASLLNSAWGRGHVSGVLVGVAQQHFNVGAARDLKTVFPRLRVQQRIGSLVRAYCDLIEVNQRRIAILEDMARRLFDEWFVRFRYPGHEAVPMVETELGVVPGGWQPGTFRECAEVNPETLSPRGAPHKINYIDISSVSVGRVDAVATMEFSQAPGRARRLVRDGDIIWSTVRPNRRSHALLLEVAPNTVASTGFAALRSRNSDWAWIYEATRTDAFVGFLVGRARGAAYPAVVGADFEDVPLVVPPLDLRFTFQTQVGPMHELASTLHRQNNKLRAARDLLLPKLISGEIDVSVAEETLAQAAE